tara:strand:+ start:159 stop:356 length:198 start_codon:yes stop_codon:yes gene_type:complete
MKKTYLIEKQLAESFLYGQIELYKIEFAETGNNKYLKVMNDLNRTINTFKKMDLAINKLILEKNK